MLLQQLIGSPAKEICVVIHWNNAQSPSIVICPGLKTGKLGFSGMFAFMARECHRLGMNVFLFDYLGDGESAGTYEDITINSLLHSTQAVIRFAEDLGCTSMALVGWGIGNIVASYLSQLNRINVMTLLWPDFNSLSHLPPTISVKDLSENEYEYLEIDFETINELAAEFDFFKALVGKTAPTWKKPRNHGPVSLQVLCEVTKMKPLEKLNELSKPVLVILDEEQEQIDMAYSALGWTDLIQFSKNLKLGDLTGSRKRYFWEEISILVSSWLFSKLQFGRGENGTPTLVLEQSQDKSENYSRVERARMHSLTFTIHGQEILGILHIPTSTFKGTRPCVIYEPGLGGNRTEIAWSDIGFIDALLAKGIYVLRYDFRGSGVSAGESSEMTLTKRLEDLDHVLKKLREIGQIDMDQIALLSWSAGAKIACYAANHIEGICGVLLWSPVLIDPDDGDGHLARFSRESNGSLVTRAGQLAKGIEYFADLKRYNFLSEFESCRKPMLMIFGKDDDDLETRKFVEKSSVSHIEKNFIEVSGGHLFSRLCLKDEVSVTSITWLINMFGDGLTC